jgi:hypothetical protein
VTPGYSHDLILIVDRYVIYDPPQPHFLLFLFFFFFFIIIISDVQYYLRLLLESKCNFKDHYHTSPNVVVVVMSPFDVFHVACLALQAISDLAYLAFALPTIR